MKNIFFAWFLISYSKCFYRTNTAAAGGGKSSTSFDGLDLIDENEKNLHIKVDILREDKVTDTSLKTVV